MTTLTPEAKLFLSTTVCRLRERLIRDIRDEAERRYRLLLPVGRAGLDQAGRARRARLETWLDEKLRIAHLDNEVDIIAAREGFLAQGIKEVGATLINRLVAIRHLESKGICKPHVVTGGWNSRGYQEFREFAPGVITDETEGFATLLIVLFDELAVDLPGLFGDVGLTTLLPIPASTLRKVIVALDDKELESAWADDTTLGWVYQFWNDPERKEIDTRLDAQGKLASTDVASKTQVFTERYMVEWLLQNSLGLTWLCICKKNGWTPDAERVLPVLDARRADWRKKRDAGEVALDALMPIEGELEDAWKYYVSQPIPEDAVEKAPDSISNLKLLDPACGSGHFLVIAFDLIVRMYREEARHRQQEISDQEIAESILANNLHGVDIDPRAIQIAAAALYLKAKSLSHQASPAQLNLVAPILQLGKLPEEDPSITQLRSELKREVNIPEELTKQLISSLSGVDHLGTLLKVDADIEEALRSTESEIERGLPGQGDLFMGFSSQQAKTSAVEAKLTILDKLEEFLAKHSASEDLGLRIDGEQLAAGVRFVRVARKGYYDVVVGNPPYFGTQALADTKYIDRRYPQSKENLCTAMLDRAMDLARPGGIVAFVTIRNWLYVSQLSAFRDRTFKSFPPIRAVDLGLGGFESLPGVEGMLVVSQEAATSECFVICSRDSSVAAKVASMMCCADNYCTNPALLGQLPGSPFVYRWSRSFVEDYLSRQLLGEIAPVRVGMKTSDNTRFVRRPWELAHSESNRAVEQPSEANWVPYVKGAAGKIWIEPLSDLVNWRDQGLEIRMALDSAYGQGPQGEKHYFKPAVAFTTIGRSFLARAHRFPSIFDVAGSSVFPSDVAATVCLLNSRFATAIVEELNPTINFQVGDVGRIPYRPDPKAAFIFETVEQAFTDHEKIEETSFRFKRPGPTSWNSAQTWARLAIDRSDGAPLPPFEVLYDEPTAASMVSFAVGVALGRLDVSGEGILDKCPPTALPSGILFISIDERDSIEHSACKLLYDVWTEHGAVVGAGDDLREYLRKSFFDYHRKLYDNRPIYFPLSSAKKNYVAFVSIHRWKNDTLQVLLADFLIPEKRRLEGELEDIRAARAEATGKGKAEKRFAEIQKLLEDLEDFVRNVTEIAECGPNSTDQASPKREVDARYRLDLEDGVMVSSSALWPLLEPHWKDPKKWWTQLAGRSGPKGSNFDWSQTAKRYFPNRIAEECQRNPVLASAQRCLWQYHPAVAYSWELRLKHDIRTDFAISEESADASRSKFLEKQSGEAQRIQEAALKRQVRRSKDRPSAIEGADG